MISKLFDMVLNFITKTIGTTLTVVIVVFGLGIYVAVSYPLSDYVVTPDTLQKVVARVDLRQVEAELSSFRTEQFQLEDMLDTPKPKTRYINRLKEVVKRINQLESDKKGLMDILDPNKKEK
jgi:hypothetical protein